MPTVGYGYQEALASLKRGVKTAEDRMAKAATKTMREAAKQVESQVRAEIGSHGFSRRWQTSFFARAKPRVGYSLNASMRGYDRIPFVNIFERGGTIRTKEKAAALAAASHNPEEDRPQADNATALHQEHRSAAQHQCAGQAAHARG